VPPGIVTQLTRGKLPDIPIHAVHLDPVAACNYACEGCIEKAVRLKRRCLSTEALDRILVDIRELGCRELRFYGGEPTLHPHFGRIIRSASAMGFNIMVVTNGSMLGEPLVRQALVKAKSNVNVRVSVDAHSEQTHRLQHGIPAGMRAYWASFVENIVNLRVQGVAIGVSYLIRAASLDELEEACAFWHARPQGCSFRRAVLFNPRIPMAPNGKWIGVGANEARVRDTLHRVREQYGEWVVIPDWVSSWVGAPRAGDPTEAPGQYGRCLSAYYRIGISPAEEGPSLGKVVLSDSTSLDVTDEAWISLCLYHRYDPRFGCAYPKDLAEWARGGRMQTVARLDPRKACIGTLCSRTAANEYVENAVRRQRQVPVEGGVARGSGARVARRRRIR
jgi:hypothetical protein